jgi:hypothetical protein
MVKVGDVIVGNRKPIMNAAVRLEAFDEVLSEAVERN